MVDEGVTCFDSLNGIVSEFVLPWYAEYLVFVVQELTANFAVDEIFRHAYLGTKSVLVEAV